MSDTRMEMVFCSVAVEGRTYQELDAAARQHGANFFEVPIEAVKIAMVPQAHVTKSSRHAEGSVPELWQATFRVGTAKEVDEIGSSWPDGDEDQDDADIE